MRRDRAARHQALRQGSYERAGDRRGLSDASRHECEQIEPLTPAALSNLLRDALTLEIVAGDTTRGIHTRVGHILDQLRQCLSARALCVKLVHAFPLV